MSERGGSCTWQPMRDRCAPVVMERPRLHSPEMLGLLAGVLRSVEWRRGWLRPWRRYRMVREW